MADAVKITVKGVAELEKLLKELGPQTASRLAGRALSAAGRPIVKRMKQLAPQPGPDDPYATGETKKAIGQRLRRYRSGSNERILVIGVERPRSRIFHLLEFGAAHMPAEPFARPALDELSHQAVQIKGRVLGEQIEKEVAKLAAKYKTMDPK